MNFQIMQHPVALATAIGTQRVKIQRADSNGNESISGVRLQINIFLLIFVLFLVLLKIGICGLYYE